MFTLVRCTSVKAEEEGDYEHASHGPLGDHFSQLRSSPPMLSVAARAHRKHSDCFANSCLMEWGSLSLSPELGLPPFCLCGFERT